ncbi:MAG: hypothetical protein IPH91_09780 [Elusimicrobia bacterium]|nr:hypothetical protein [Elusimicrobiota bacterium]MBK8126962.1 hypothetical protein [Elusimicrobiota bacterium]
MTKNNQDLYEKFRELIKELKTDTWAIRFQAALEISSVPGEILGQIRLELTAFLKDTKTSDFHTRAKEMKKYLDMIL